VGPDRRPARLVASTTRVVRSFASPAGPVPALAGVDIAVIARRLTVVAGPSGSGKSTLLGLLACLDRPDEGDVEVDGTDVLALTRKQRRQLRRRAIGLVLPQPADNLLERDDAAGNLRWCAKVRGVEGADAVAALGAVGLESAVAKRVAQLSGGEQQRLALACALVGDPTLVVADEPTASLDRANAVAVVDVMRMAADRGVTLVVASHDPRVIEIADVVVRLDHGRRVA
jgi:putative ABC transport system ATP-binding protein